MSNDECEKILSFYLKQFENPDIIKMLWFDPIDGFGEYLKKNIRFYRLIIF